MNRFCILVCCLLVIGCNADDWPTQPQQLVVEGWIEDGDFPVVIVTKTLPISTENIYADNLSDYVARWARVVVSDGVDSVVLTGRRDDNYFPPYIYTTSSICGKSGNKYILTVDDGQHHVTATTTIPPRAYADSIIVRQGSMNDTLFSLSALVRRQEPNRYFNFFVMDYRTRRYFLSSFLGNFTSNELPIDGPREIAINRGQAHLDFNVDYTPYFSYGDTAIIKLAAMDSTAYAFWHAYDKMVSLSRNPMFPYNSSLPTNIKGSIGYWAGYGANTYMVVFQ